MKIVCVADTHGKHESIELPDGDVLIHAGDFTSYGDPKKATSFLSWFGNREHDHKIIVSGNHETCLAPGSDHRSGIKEKIEEIGHYLEDDEVTIDSVKFYGSPWTPRFLNWAFMKSRGDELAAVWDRIPGDTDVLITHGPPHGILDRAESIVATLRSLNPLTDSTRNVGCRELETAVRRVSPDYHVFGHIHECYGTETLANTTCFNVSTVNGRYEPVNAPVVFEL